MSKSSHICEVSGRWVPTLDEHHVIPREYGGINGPTVWIDPAIHQAVHRYAHNSKKLDTFLAGYESAEVMARIRMLVTAIKEAEATLDRAQPTVLQITLKPEEYKKLTELAKRMSVSEPELVKRLVKRFLED